MDSLYLPAGTTGKAPSQLSTFTEEEQQMKNIEKLTIQLHNMTLERKELRGILAYYNNKDLNNRSTQKDMKLNGMANNKDQAKSLHSFSAC
ncbi:hypothetical protein A6R68_20034 [Neotoma lepida]|uniref:Disks large homolog 5 N-terminal domain-containing protein n=1 Tax=Neotoma lepida TaxID=56216 RepID=A0A1A6HIV8_NEOLE|nr:hypothetical protein A6R68_20034 [Neotoma lepida]